MDKTHVPYPGCYCADCVEGGKPIGYINAEMLNRKSEFEANGIVMTAVPQGMSTLPLYAARPVQSELVEALRSAIAAIEDDTGLDDAICCSGLDCGCRAATHRQLLLHNLHETLKETDNG